MGKVSPSSFVDVYHCGETGRENQTIKGTLQYLLSFVHSCTPEEGQQGAVPQFVQSAGDILSRPDVKNKKADTWLYTILRAVIYMTTVRRKQAIYISVYRVIHSFWITTYYKPNCLLWHLYLGTASTFSQRVSSSFLEHSSFSLCNPLYHLDHHLQVQSHASKPCWDMLKHQVNIATRNPSKTFLVLKDWGDHIVRSSL